jgi:hypothetical protein
MTPEYPPNKKDFLKPLAPLRLVQIETGTRIE